MKWFNVLTGRLRVLFRRDAVIKDIDEEMRLHLEMERQRLIESGMTPDEAALAARKIFGNPAGMKDLGFQYRGGNVMDAFYRDVRLGIRMLFKTPGSTFIAMLTLALGIGATAAVFSLIQGVLLTPPPYDHPDRIVLIQSVRTDGKDKGRPASFIQEQRWTPGQIAEWQTEAKSFESFGAYAWTFNFLVLPDGSRSMEGMVVTEDYFKVLGLKPLLGRSFPEKVDPKAPAIVLGYDFWQQQFNGDPGIVGKTIQISRWDNLPTVIGVMPHGVRFLPSNGASREPNYDVNAKVDFWVPIVPDPKRVNEADWEVVARLNGGASPMDGQAELAVLVNREAETNRDYAAIAPQVKLLKTESNREGYRILLPLLGAAVLVLIIACGNVAALLLVRGLGRQQEYAVRCALGAGRVTLFRQTSTESLLLALLGGGCGVGVALAIVRLFKLVGGHAIPRLDAVSAAWPVIACGLGAAVIAAGIAGLFPALRASSLDPIAVINSAGPKSSVGLGERRLLRGVVMAQTSLTLVLLVAAGLLIRTMNNLANVRPGYDTARTLTMTVADINEKGWTDFHRRALERVAKLPGVQQVAFGWGVPLTGNSWPAGVEVEGQPPPEADADLTPIPLRAVTEDYFQLLGQSMIDGREFRSTDADKAPQVAVVNEAFAHRFFPDQQTVGKKFWFDRRRETATQIVGVVTNTRTDDLTTEPVPEIYLPMWQTHVFSKSLVIRTTADPHSLIVPVQRELRSIDPTVAVENVKTLEQVRTDSQASRNFAMQLLVGFSTVASVLSLVGIYGVLSLSVAGRRREIAIRTAIGARRQDVLRLVLREGFRLVAIGIAVGLGAAVILSRALSAFLFGVRPTDPMTLIVMAMLFAAVALLASLIPARRAAKVDPVVALRYE